MKGFSVVYVMEEGRIPLYRNTIEVFKKFGLPDEVEFIISSRTIKDVSQVAIDGVDVKLVNYEYEGRYFCPSKGFNEGVKVTKYDNIVIAFPEVKPITDFFGIISTLDKGVYMATVYDMKENGQRAQTILKPGYRDETPAYYFLAVYPKESILNINGWDEDYMGGYWYDDDEFGWRMKQSGVSFEVRSDIEGEHQYHDRGHYTESAEAKAGMALNYTRFKVTRGRTKARCRNGIEK